MSLIFPITLWLSTATPYTTTMPQLQALGDSDSSCEDFSSFIRVTTVITFRNFKIHVGDFLFSSVDHVLHPILAFYSHGHMNGVFVITNVNLSIIPISNIALSGHLLSS